ncbi:hypothetical protein CTA1_12694 [Colletotrichum tanaceti]|uniref:Uncharacterized protein n=1 Tax=Colletotrichum tanaceti TaxID=1306861 RepID=A0A4U6XCH5_9PEZI|nr:hypothetical protein CTA1_12694 [Colletotrichum tanaceti]
MTGALPLGRGAFVPANPFVLARAGTGSRLQAVGLLDGMAAQAERSSGPAWGSKTGLEWMGRGCGQGVKGSEFQEAES